MRLTQYKNSEHKRAVLDFETTQSQNKTQLFSSIRSRGYELDVIEATPNHILKHTHLQCGRKSVLSLGQMKNAPAAAAAAGLSASMAAVAS